MLKFELRSSLCFRCFFVRYFQVLFLCVDYRYCCRICLAIGFLLWSLLPLGSSKQSVEFPMKPLEKKLLEKTAVFSSAGSPPSTPLF